MRALPVARNTLTSVARIVVWNRYLEKFMAIGSLGEDAVFSFSDDLLNWSEQQLLAAVETPSRRLPGDPSLPDAGRPGRSRGLRGERPAASRR